MLHCDRCGREIDMGIDTDASVPREDEYTVASGITVCGACVNAARQQPDEPATIVIDTPAGMERFRLLQLKYAMKLEIETGMKHSRLGSIVNKVKKQYGYKGNKQAVYEQFCKAHGLP